MIDIADEVLNDHIPDSILFDPQVVSIGNVSDLQKNALLPIIDQIRVLCNIPNLPEFALDLLAFQYQTLFYTGTLSITDPVARIAAKRALVATSWDFHTRLGVPATMQQIISTIYQAASIQEWFQYGGTPNHFRILTDNVINDPIIISNITQTIQVTKRASQTFEGFFTRNTATIQTIFVSVSVYSQVFQILPIARIDTRFTVLTPSARVLARAVNTIFSACNLAIGVNIVADPYSKAKLVPHAALTGTPRMAMGLGVGIGRKITIVVTGKVTHGATLAISRGISIVAVNVGGH